MSPEQDQTTASLQSTLPSIDKTYAHIARALARGYTDLYYVNMETGEFVEFHTDDDLGVLSEARRGTDFFGGCERDAALFVHPEDQAAFTEAMNRQFLEGKRSGQAHPPYGDYVPRQEPHYRLHREHRSRGSDGTCP